MEKDKEVCPICLGKKEIPKGFGGWYMGEEPCTACEETGYLIKKELI